jgi:hypothetical protein
VKEMRKITRHLSQVSRFLIRDCNPRTAEYDVGILHDVRYLSFDRTIILK